MLTVRYSDDGEEHKIRKGQVKRYKMKGERGMGKDKYFWDNRPRCVKEFFTERAELEEVAFDGHGTVVNTVFKLGCKCGGEKMFVNGYHWKNPDFDNVEVFISPIELECELCGKAAELIDTDVHGYDAELGHGSCTGRGKGGRNRFSCPKCRPSSMEVYVRFEYPDDLLDDEFDSFEDFRGREQDLFTWFTLLGRCTTCGELIGISDLECA
jgi:hypothetical protein